MMREALVHQIMMMIAVVMMLKMIIIKIMPKVVEMMTMKMQEAPAHLMMRMMWW